MNHELFLVGTYTGKKSHVPDPQGEGIHLCERILGSGSMIILDTLTGLKNPSYITQDSRTGLIYAVCETDSGGGGVASLQRKGNTLELLSLRTGLGNAGCHLSVHQERNEIMTASYGDGRAVGYSLGAQGAEDVAWNVAYAGSGPAGERQASAHAHQILPSLHGDKIYVCDLGSDRVWMHDVSRAGAHPQTALVAPPGTGPRHLALHPSGDWAFILCELAPHLYVARIRQEDGSMKLLEQHLACEPSQQGIAAPAAIKIHPSGNTLAISSRFDDSISIFRIRIDSSPMLELVMRFSSPGRTPRDISFSHEGLYVAAQDDHRMAFRPFDPPTGWPAGDWSGSMEIGSPSCVLPL
ncbi:MAG: lactonase family protein [Spirochaetales bacterium]|nr:lactonase family protein [Spirochaetales bacterium]